MTIIHVAINNAIAPVINLLSRSKCYSPIETVNKACMNIKDI